MSSRKVKGDAGEAAWKAQREAEGWWCFPGSPAFPGVDLLSFHPDGRIELAEVKASVYVAPGKRAEAIRRLLEVREDVRMPRWVRKRLTCVLVHAMHGEDGEWQCAEMWRGP